MTPSGYRAWVPVAVVAVAAALFLGPLVLQPTGFPFAVGADYSDALVAHLTSADFLHRTVVTTREIPLWNPTILSGMPFAADPLSGLWYPPLWLLALAPAAATMNLLFWIHLAFGGCGMFLLMRSEDVGPLASLAGGIAFAGMPKLLGHVGLGHLTLVPAVCWSPWILWLVDRAVEGVGRARGRRRFLVLGAAVGIVFLADPRWLLPMLIVAAGYGIWRGAIRRAGPVPFRQAAWGLAAAGLSFIAVVAILAIPFVEFVALSTRAHLTADSSAVFSLPPARLIGLLVSTSGEWGEWLVSMGAVAIVLAAVGLAATLRRAIFWACLMAMALIFAVGPATPIGRFLGDLPPADLLRVPARWLFFSGMAIAGLAAHGLGVLESGAGPTVRRRARLAAVFTAAVAVAVSLAFAFASDARLGTTAAFATLAAAGVWLGTSASRRGWLVPALIVALALELFLIDVTLVEARPAETALEPGRTIAARLAGEGAGRIFSPSYAVPQEAAAEAGLELADGVHPLQLASYVAFMGRAAGLPASEYSVTLPPFPGGDPSVDWGPRLDAAALGLLGVERVVSTFPVESPGLREEGTLDGVHVYRNEMARPLARVESEAGEPDQWTPAEVLDRTPNRWTLAATGPGILVVADPMYPGWTATVDGERAAIETYQGVLKAVRLGEGDHRVDFRFAPTSLILGLGLSLAALGLAVVLWRRG